jgi:two-component system cell cycle sensor histidine kinase/response regulator CckA
MSERHSVEEHYRLLFDHNPQPMWVYDAESWQFLTVNQAAIERYGYTREEFLRMRITDIRPREDVAALAEDIAARGDAALQRSGVWRHRLRDGTIILVEIASHEIPFAGRRGRLVLAHDVTDRERALDEIRRTSDANERHYEALAALTRRGILETDDLSRALREITQNTAHTLDIERVSVWRMTHERDAIVAHDLFERAPGRHSQGVRLAEADFPAYFRALQENDLLVANDAEADPRTCEFADTYLRPLGISSMLDAPIIVGGFVDGVLCLEHVGPRRTWSAGERSFAVSAANLISLIIAQQSLVESRAWLRAILDSEPECVSLVSPVGALLDMNPAGLAMIEAPDRASVLGVNALEIVHPDHHDDYLALLRNVYAGGTGHLQFRIVGLGGTERWVETHAAPLRASTGTVEAMLAVTRDMTERLRAEAALHESQRRLSTLMDHLPGMAYRCRVEPDWPMEFVSNGAAALTGHDPADLLEHGASAYGTLIHPDDRDRLWQQVRDAIRINAPFEVEYRITCADGTVKWVWERGRAVYDDAGHAVAIEGFISDTTARRRSEHALRVSEERFRTLARATSDAIYDWDIATNVLWWSDGAEDLFGLTRDELGNVLDSWSEHIHPDDRDRVLDGLTDAVESDAETWTAEYRFRRGDGSYATVLDRGLVMRDAAGSAIRMIGGVSDLTERKRLEDQLLHSQKMESVGRLAGGVAHDFNNLLTVILGTVDLVLDAVDTADPLASDLGDVRRAAERAAGLTQQLLAFSRRQVLQPRVLDINDAISSALVLLRRVIGEDVEIRYAPEPGIWPVRADPGQLEQVLLNLAINARDAMPTGGTLTIETRNVTRDDGDSVEITIADTGIGMDESIRERAFEPFFTTKPVGKGTGLGLATVYGIIQQSGGSIHLDSERGRGTSFRILLPRVEWSAPADAPADAVLPQRGSETILLVEDELGVRRLTERVLRGAGYTVLSVGSGAEALRALETHDGFVDLLLTDVVMPVMNGPDLARRLLQRSPRTRVLFMSGYTDDAIVRHGVHAGHTQLLEKPFTVTDLTHAVRDALAS